GNAGCSVPDRCSLRVIQYHSQPELAAGLLGLHVSLLRADYNAGARGDRDAAALANPSLIGHRHHDRSRIDLAGITHLPHRNVDDGKEGHAAGSVALAATIMTSHE